MYKKPKISLIGAGNIGGLLAQMISQRNLADLAVIDINEGPAKGKALDIAQSNSVYGSDAELKGGSDISLIKDSDIVVVTAGKARKPGMSRDDLIDINSKIISGIAKDISRFCPQSFVIVVTNPLDVMVHLMHRHSGLNSSKVVGMAGILDSARFAHFLSQELKISIENIDCFVLGGHGDSMVPLPRYSTAAGINLNQIVKMGWMSQQRLDEIIDRTRNGGAEIVNLFGNGSAYHAPAASVLDMIESYLYSKRKILPCCARLQGEYGYKDLYVGVPVIIGSGGVEKVIEVELNNDESADFAKSVQSVQNLISGISE